MISDKIIQRYRFWENDAPSREIVFSNRVSLSRNAINLPFGKKMRIADRTELKEYAEKYIQAFSSKEGHEFIEISELELSQKRYFRELGLITSEMEASPYAMLIMNSEGRYSIQINDQDHFRIQVSMPGFNIEEGYRTAEEIDENLSRIAHFAFDDQFGYLGADISSIGTGMRVSAVLHLPSITLAGTISGLSNNIKDSPVSLSGFSDLNGANSGAMYQVINRITLGISEIDIIETMDAVISRIISDEEEEREALYKNTRRSLEDRILRSYGILKFAKIITYSEALNHLSNVRLGVILAFIKGRRLNEIDSVMINIQKCHIEKIFNRITDSAEECDMLRAEYLNRQMG